MIIIYFPGFAGSPDKDSSKVKMMTTLGYDVFIVDPEENYTPSSYLLAFQHVLSEHKIKLSDPFMLMGISLGGFWARYLGYQLQVPWISLNPPLTPSTQLRQFIGKNVVFDTGNEFIWTENHCNEYLNFETHVKDFLSIPGLIIFSKDDDVLSHTDLKSLKSRCSVIELEDGGHRLLKTDTYKQYIQQFIKYSFI